MPHGFMHGHMSMPLPGQNDLSIFTEVLECGRRQDGDMDKFAGLPSQKE